MPNLDGPLTAIALCWSLERPDGAGVGITSHDRQLPNAGISYDPAPGLVPAAVTRALGLEPHSAEVAGALSASALEADDLALGRWDGARARLTAADWEMPGEPPVDLIAGELGNVSLDGESFSADLLGAAARLEVGICPATSPGCRAHFGDKSCRVDLAGRTTLARVTGSSDGELTLDQPFDDRFLLGRLRYMSGANCGLTTVITSVAGSVVGVRDLPRGAVEDGCRVELREGCDKQFVTCSERFANAINFRGEPHLPGSDMLTRYPGV